MTKSVVIPYSIYQDILREAVSAAENGIESIGILIGKKKKDQLLITESIYKGTGTQTRVTIEDYSFLTEVLTEERIEAGESVIGWWHSHPQGENRLSITDITTHSRYQQLSEETIALLVLPPEVNRGERGIKAFKLDKLLQNPIEIKIEIK